MISHTYLGAADLRLMQETVIRGYDSTETRIGDLAWRVSLPKRREGVGESWRART